ncbi:Ig-like domain-containing protein [Roseiconus lacunae]|uniref:Ig-like domain-containing protein n=1 Tax=Roseiconus lacunae TaxID=2605694 RepID=UPI001E3B7BF8|nr:Ig-like domain-containing protein [Roseiconus lacunae]MCD0461883.1 Ig-like domain-containing protein [Roseiconus lacunae]
MSQKRKSTARCRTRRGMLLESLQSRLAMDASLSGYVFIDSDGNGTHGSQEHGLPGVEMSLTGTTTAGESIQQSVLTASNGAYQFDQLAPGTYRVTQRQPEATIDGQDASGHSGAVVDNDDVSNLVIDGDDEVTGINFGERGLKPGYVNLAWFLASTPSQSEMLRESVARGEQSIGNTDLADAIRDGSSDPPPTTPDPDPTDPNPDENDAPVAVADTYTVVENQTLTVSAANGVLNNDTDAEDDPLTATLVTNPSDGTLTFATDGSFTYVPDADFVGTDSFVYRASDSEEQSTSVTVTITVTADPTSANEFTVDENAAVGTFVGSVQASSALGSNVVYEFPDASIASALRLQPDDHFSGEGDAPVVIIEYSDLSCSHCAEAHEVTKQLLSNFSSELLIVHRHLVLENNGEFIFPNSMAAAKAAEAAGRQGKYNAMVDLLFSNQDDWKAASDPTSIFNAYAQQLQIDLTQFASDQQDQAIEDRINRDRTTAQQLGLSSTPSFFFNGEAIANPETLAGFTSVVQSKLSEVDQTFALNRLNGDLTVAQTNDLDFETTPKFEFIVRATGDTTESIDVTVNLFDANELAPVAQDDSYVANAGQELVVSAAEGLLANDTDADSTTLYANLTTNPSNGTVTLNEDGSFTYSPDAGFTGTDTFTYRADDGNFAADETTVSIEVRQGPVANADSYSTGEESALVVNVAEGVLANDSDPDSDPLTAQLVSGPSNGSLTLNSDGSFTYTPDTNFSGQDSFSYQANDGTSLSNSATVTVTVEDQNAFTVAENSAAGTLVGTLTPETNLGDNVLFEVDNPNLPGELRLVADDHLTGDAAAPVVLIEYMDLSCPHCADIHAVIKQLQSEFGDELLVVRRHLLLFNSGTNSFIFPNSQAAARVAEAAARQGKFDEMVDLLFTNQDAWRSLADPTSVFNGYAQQLSLDMTQFANDQVDAQLEARIERDRISASNLGLTSTPSFFLNGSTLSNPETIEAFRPVIQAELNAVDEVFTLDRLTGEIFVADSTELDFETTPVFNLDITARGTSTEAIDVVIELLDVAE